MSKHTGCSTAIVMDYFSTLLASGRSGRPVFLSLHSVSSECSFPSAMFAWCVKICTIGALDRLGLQAYAVLEDNIVQVMVRGCIITVPNKGC